MVPLLQLVVARGSMMPDTSIDLSEGIQSVRLKVPTAVVPIPPEGFAQLHSPVEGELALRLPDGSVVAVGGGGGGGGAATSVLGPGGAIDAANSDPRIGININAAPGTGIGLTGELLDQYAVPLVLQPFIAFRSQTVPIALSGGANAVTVALVVDGSFQQVRRGAWTNTVDGDLVVPAAGWYEVAIGYVVTVPGSGDINLSLNSDTSTDAINGEQFTPEGITGSIAGTLLGRAHIAAGHNVGQLYGFVGSGTVPSLIKASVRLSALALD